MKHLTRYVLILILLSLPGAAFAEQWKIDKNHAAVNFKVKHVFSMVPGHFTDFDGDFVFSPDDVKNSRFEFSINVDSIDTFNTKRDTHLKSKDFFEADRFPVMTFKSTGISHKMGNTYILKGDLTIKDVTRPVTLEFQFHGPTDAPFSKNELVAGFDTAFTIDRLEYHVGDGKFLKMGVVGQYVDIAISLEALRSK